MNVDVVTPFVRYSPAGEIIEYGRQDRSITAAWRNEGQPVLEGAGDYSHFVDLRTMRILPKARNPAVINGLTITSLPRPCAVKISRAGTHTAMTVAVEDGRLELEFPFPGTYRVEVVSVRHLPKTFEVTT